jgi:FkbH-like protein
VGWKSLRLGGHDPIGEAYVDFQKGLKTLLKRGIVLGIVSKNEEKSALHAIRKHPEMVLTLDDFAGWRINWNDKAQNLLDLVDEINVGLDSVVFIDDNPVERARVREALPEVLVPEWPDNPLYYQTELLSLNCFDTTSLSLEDLSRAQMYVSERKRRDLGRQAGSLDEWLKTLSIAVQAERLGEANLERAAQLFNKTNQMNLTTRRMTPEELKKWSEREGHDLWVFRVSDRFGDSGLTGIASLVQEGERGRILDFILSCRVMGRRIEETMLSVIITKAKTLGLSEVFAQYAPTTKNKPCLSFLEGSGLERTSEDIFRWNMEKTYEPPPMIKVISTSGP